MNSPILFLIFNRPDTTEKVWQIITKAKPPRLYIAADGPRLDRLDEAKKCEETRKITEKVDWPCEVKRLYRPENLGCGKGVSGAITWFFQNEEQGIIIEDDIEANPDFFEYCDIMLDRYSENQSVQMIVGHNAFYNGYESDVTYYMSSLFHMWGWATWRRVWDTYVFDAKTLDGSLFDQKLSSRDLPKGCIRYWMSVFDMMQNHPSDTWDYQLYFNQILNDRYSIIPYKNLTRNIGFTEDATHTTKENINEMRHTAESPLPINHPINSHFDKNADRVFAENYGFYSFSWLERLFRVIKKHFL